MRLYEHKLHPYVPQNVNKQHKAEQGLNTRIAIRLTHSVGSMWTAYLFIILAVVGLLGILGIISPIVALLVAWTSQTLIQLVLLPVIMVGQNVLGRKSELQADEAYQTTMKTYHDIEQVLKHLEAEDAELLKHTNILLAIVEHTKRNRS
jgi:uncharacterized membrane protein